MNIQDLEGEYSVFSNAGIPWQIQDLHYPKKGYFPDRGLN